MLGKIGELLKGVSEIVEKAGIDETESEKDAAAEEWFVEPEMADGNVADSGIESQDLAGGGVADTSTESLNHNDAQPFAQIADAFENLVSSIERDANNITSELDGSNSFENITDSFAPSTTTTIADTQAAAVALKQIGANAYTNGESFGPGVETGFAAHENAHVSQHSNTATDIAENVSVDEAISILEQARTTLNESRFDSDLRDVVNHPDAMTMLENLQAAGVDELTVSGSDIEGLSAEEQITSVLQAAQEATYEQGLDMPEVEQEMTQEAMTTSFDYQQYDHGNDDYGIV